jgi:hypothetical protein
MPFTWQTGKDLSNRRHNKIHKNNMTENKWYIPREHFADDSVYTCKSNVEQKLNPLEVLLKSKLSVPMIPLLFNVQQQYPNLKYPLSSPCTSTRLGKQVLHSGILYCIGQRKILVFISFTKSGTDLPLRLVSQDLTQIIYLFLSPDSALG